jgi:general secretion pathway protein G
MRIRDSGIRIQDRGARIEPASGYAIRADGTEGTARRALSPNSILNSRSSILGFTLIEMIVVMTLISLLLTLAIPRYLSAVDNGRFNVRKQNVATMRDAIDKFFGDQGKYPETLDELVARRYLREVPLDPVTETANWVVVAPPDPTLGAVYDVQPPPQTARASKSGR